SEGVRSAAHRRRRGPTRRTRTRRLGPPGAASHARATTHAAKAYVRRHETTRRNAAGSWLAGIHAHPVAELRSCCTLATWPHVSDQIVTRLEDTVVTPLDATEVFTCELVVRQALREDPQRLGPAPAFVEDPIQLGECFITTMRIVHVPAAAGQCSVQHECDGPLRIGRSEQETHRAALGHAHERRTLRAHRVHDRTARRPFALRVSGAHIVTRQSKRRLIAQNDALSGAPERTQPALCATGSATRRGSPHTPTCSATSPDP